jgi:hypothetical protein
MRIRDGRPTDSDEKCQPCLVISTTLIQKELRWKGSLRRYEGEGIEDVSRKDARREVKIIHR